MKSNFLQRAGAICAIVGTIITGIFNGMHPDLADPAGIVRSAAGSSYWTTIHWGLIIGMVLMQLGFSVVTQTLRSPKENSEAGDWGVLGIYMLMGGLILWICVFTAEAGLKPLADGMQSKQIHQGGAFALANFVDATATAATIVYWLGIALLGMALRLSKRYPNWVGIMGLTVGGSMTLSIGLSKAFFGASAWTEGFGFQALAILFLAWSVMLGTLLWRNSDKCFEI